MKKNQLRGVIVLIVIAVIYSVVVFAVPFHKGGLFWLSYLCTLISLAAAGYASDSAFFHGEGAKSKFYGFPIAKIGMTYFVVQLVLGIIFMAISAAPLWLALILYVILMGAAVIGFIAADAVREEIEHQDVKLKKDVSAMRALQSKANSLTGLCKDSDLRKAVEKFAENLRFSDPVSSEALQGIEGELSRCITELECAVVDADNSSAQTLCRKAESLLVERNRLCKLGK
jgi:hypothetical protein